MHSSGAALYHTIMFQYRSDGSEEAFYIHSKAQLFHILSIQLSLHRDLQFIAAVDLCPSCQTRQDIVSTVFVSLCNQVILIPQSWSRTHDSHLPFQDIEELGKLIQAGLAQKFPGFGNILLRVCQHMRRHVLGSVRTHGTEFIDFKEFLVLAYALLMEEHRSRGVQFDAEHQNKQHRTEHDGSSQAQQKIYDSFDGNVYLCSCTIHVVFSLMGRTVQINAQLILYILTPMQGKCNPSLGKIQCSQSKRFKATGQRLPQL